MPGEGFGICENSRNGCGPPDPRYVLELYIYIYIFFFFFFFFFFSWVAFSRTVLDHFEKPPSRFRVLERKVAGFRV